MWTRLIQAGIALYVSAEVFPEPGNITCGVYDGSGSITLDSSACADRSQNYAVPCIYNGKYTLYITIPLKVS